MRLDDAADGVVLDQHNGRPSMWISTTADEPPVLHWLVLGYLEDRDVWLDAPLTWDEAVRYVDTPPASLGAFLGTSAGRSGCLRFGGSS